MIKFVMSASMSAAVPEPEHYRFNRPTRSKIAGKRSINSHKILETSAYFEPNLRRENSMGFAEMSALFQTKFIKCET